MSWENLHGWGDNNNCLLQFRQAKTEIVSASKAAYRFFSCVTNDVKTGLGSPSNSNRGGSHRVLQAAWLKNLVTNGAKPASSSEAGNRGEVKPHQQGNATTTKLASSHGSWVKLFGNIGLYVPIVSQKSKGNFLTCYSLFIKMLSDHFLFNSDFLIVLLRNMILLFLFNSLGDWICVACS